MDDEEKNRIKRLYNPRLSAVVNEAGPPSQNGYQNEAKRPRIKESDWLLRHKSRALIGLEKRETRSDWLKDNRIIHKKRSDWVKIQ